MKNNKNNDEDPTGKDKILSYYMKAFKVAKKKLDEITPIHNQSISDYNDALKKVLGIDPSFDISNL
jgi:hypothetical protein